MVLRVMPKLRLGHPPDGVSHEQEVFPVHVALRETIQDIPVDQVLQKCLRTHQQR